MRLLSHLSQIKQSPCALINAAERFFTAAPGTAFLQPLALVGLRCALLISVLWPVLPFVVLKGQNPPHGPCGGAQAAAGSGLAAAKGPGSPLPQLPTPHSPPAPKLQRPSSLIPERIQRIPERFQRIPGSPSQRSGDFRTMVAAISVSWSHRSQ